MTNQTQDYITLKPIADRFKEVAKSITDDEIKCMIKDELRNQIREQVNFGFTVGQWIDDMLEDDDSWMELIKDCMKKCVKEKFHQC